MHHGKKKLFGVGGNDGLMNGGEKVTEREGREGVRGCSSVGIRGKGRMKEGV